MATYTSNLNLEKPLQTELYNVDVFNENSDKIDAGVGARVKYTDSLTLEEIIASTDLTDKVASAAAAKSLKESLSTKLELKSLVNQSGTTNPSGVLPTSLSVSNTVVLAVLAPSAYLAYPLPLNGGVWYVALEDYAGQRVANTAISYHLLYVER